MRATRRAISVTMVVIKVGIGLSSSATRGAKIVQNLATKLQMPMAVLRLADGNIRGSV